MRGTAVAATVVVILCALTLTSATPGRPALGPDGAGASRAGARGSTLGASTRPVSRPPADPPVGALPAVAAIAELRSGANPPLIDIDRSGHIVSLTAQPGTAIANPTGAGVDGFVRRYAAAFGLSSAYTAVRTRTTRLPGGDRVVRYQQVSHGIPVIGGEIVVTTDDRGRVRGAAGEATPARPSATKASVPAAAAAKAALVAARDRFGLDPAGLASGAPSLWLYDSGLIGAPGAGGARPAWWVEVSGPGAAKIATVLVDATSAAVTLVIRAKREVGLDRIVCDLNGVENVREFDLLNPTAYNCSPASPLGQQATTRAEGEAASGVADVNTAYEHLGVAHEFFRSNYSIDSFDGVAGRLRATVRACQKDIVIGGITFDFPCPYPNAFWDGQQFVFGADFATDDVTGHEYTHALIDHASQLFYAYQSGAINESLSDIFGELIDQGYDGAGEDTTKLWLLGEDLPVDPGSGVSEIRDMADPMRLGQPAVLAGTFYYNGDEDNGGVHQNSGVGNRLAYLIATGGLQPQNGLGLAKSRVLWYRVLHLLPSGADYATLGQTLTRSCVELIGHFGFTRADCFTSVRNARTATGTPHPEDSLACPSGLIAGELIFRDDFERHDTWTLDSPWHYIPSPAIPVTYAASGKGALYGHTGGATGYATLTNPITLAGGGDFSSPYLSYEVLAYGLGNIQATAEPRWQYDDVNDTSGWLDLSFIDNIASGDYTRLVHGLGWLAGKTIRLRVAVNANQEWLIDDVQISSCHQKMVGIGDFSAVWSGTSAELTFEYASSTQDHLELSYDPPIPGAPSVLPGLGVGGIVERSLLLTGLDPAVTYTVTVLLVDEIFPDAHLPVRFRFAATPSLVCLINLPPARAYWSPDRARPLPDPCRDLDLPPKVDGG